LPIACTASAESRSQIAAIHVPRASRSSVTARTLMSSCAFNERSISAITSSVRPLSPTMTTGESRCASARNSLRRDGVSGIGGVYAKGFGSGVRLSKSHSSKQWLRRHVSDPYVQRSKKEGYRSRSAYKLTEIDDRDKLLKPGMVVIDLGSAPGGWSQVLAKRVGAAATIIAIDLLPMEPVSGVIFLQGDFTARSGLAALDHALDGRKADVVLSDVAPNMTGIAVSDQARTMDLAELARDFALLHLKPEGSLLVKIFQGAGYDEYLKSLRRAFVKVVVRKPDASRDESAEQYLLARGLKQMASPPQGDRG
jgi:23S rRNA (uridine2552-2'-O)-methyltransferase